MCGVGLQELKPQTGLNDARDSSPAADTVSPVTIQIEKALVKMDSPAMQYFVSRRDEWARQDLFASPGPRQFWGPTTHQQPITVALNSGSDSLMFKIG